MTGWRDRILKEFTPRIAHLTLVADPDGLLIEETLLEAIRERGFEILPFDDSVAFRFAYESRFRSRWDRGESADLVVVIPAERHQLATLPYDLLRAGRQLSFGLNELLPGLSYPVVASLDRGHLATLYRAWMRHGANQLGDDAAKDFALLHVFDIAPALVRQPVDLLRVLLRRHYRGQRLPRTLDERLIHLLRRSEAFDSWALEAIVPDRNAFFSFLQERWPLFLDRLAGNVGDRPRDASESFSPDLEGPADLPFDHDDVRVYIDNLFVEGMLSPVSHEAGDTLRGTWASVGIHFDSEADKSRRLKGLMKAVGASIPGPGARHHEWTAFAYRWAELRRPPVGDGRPDAVGDWRADRRAADGSGSVLSRMDRAPLCGPPQPAAGPAGDGSPRAALPRKTDRAWFRRQGSAHRRGRARPRPVDGAPRRSRGPAAVPALSRRRRVRLGADHHVRVPAGNLRRKAAVLLSRRASTRPTAKRRCGANSGWTRV